MFSSVKPPEEGDGLVLRCWNARAEPVSGAWRFGRPVGRAVRLRADERDESAAELGLAEGGHTVPLAVGSYGLSTVRVKLTR